MNHKKAGIGFSLIAVVIINFLVFNIALKKEINLIELPVVNTTIYPRSKISEEDISFIEVPKSFINENMYSDKDEIIGKYSDIQTHLPTSSPFYKEVLFDEKDLPDYPSILLNDDQVVYTINSDLVKLSGNSIVMNQKVDIYTTLVRRNEKPIVDLLVSQVRVIGVKDKAGLDVTHPESSKVPHIVLLALNKDIMPIVRSCDEIAELELYAYSISERDNTLESELNEQAIILSEIFNE